MIALFRWVPPLAVLLATGGLSPAAQAESLRCNGTSASVGDSRLAVLHKCGEPTLRDSYCAPIYQPYSRHPVPWPLAGAMAGCLPVDEWLYDRGPGNLMATVRFQYGVVQSIRYGRDPQ